MLCECGLAENGLGIFVPPRRVGGDCSCVTYEVLAVLYRRELAVRIGYARIGAAPLKGPSTMEWVLTCRIGQLARRNEGRVLEQLTSAEHPVQINLSPERRARIADERLRSQGCRQGVKRLDLIKVVAAALDVAL